MLTYQILQGDCLQTLPTIESGTVHTCITSPPYFGLRDYGVDGQIGLEQSPEAYVAKLVEVFREVKRVLRDDGTLWLNLGDSYTSSGTKSGIGNNSSSTLQGGKSTQSAASSVKGKFNYDTKPKDLIGIPWRVAFALQADGWYLRQDIIWHKPNPMPESVTDRCTKAHEYIFLLSKSPKYYYDAEAIAEPVAQSSIARLSPFKTNAKMKAAGPRFGGAKYGDSDDPKHASKSGNVWTGAEKVNKRSVWTVTTKPFREAHFATFPEDLITPCILAGSREGDLVLDPFNGAGTTGIVAMRYGRRYIGCELNPEYIAMSDRRIGGIMPLLASV